MSTFETGCITLNSIMSISASSENKRSSAALVSSRHCTANKCAIRRSGRSRSRVNFTRTPFNFQPIVQTIERQCITSCLSQPVERKGARYSVSKAFAGEHVEELPNAIKHLSSGLSVRSSDPPHYDEADEHQWQARHNSDARPFATGDPQSPGSNDVGDIARDEHSTADQKTHQHAALLRRC
jgi:hypothetical protein